MGATIWICCGLAVIWLFYQDHSLDPEEPMLLTSIIVLFLLVTGAFILPFIVIGELIKWIQEYRR